MKLPRWSGSILHALGGLVIGGAAVALGIPGLLSVVTLALFGWTREVVQHDLSLSLHQWVEAASWPAGAALAWVMVAIFL